LIVVSPNWGLNIPDFATQGEYGLGYGTMKPFHLTGALLFLPGHVPQREAQVLYPGCLGDGLSIEQGTRPPA
jgi:hypothetical protein